MSPAHCRKIPSDFQGRDAAFIAAKPRPTSRDALPQKPVRLPGIRHCRIAASRPTFEDSTHQLNRNGHFLNCGEQINSVRVVASHGVQTIEQSSDGGHVAMSGDVVVERPIAPPRCVAAEPGSLSRYSSNITTVPLRTARPYRPGYERSPCYRPQSAPPTYAANSAVILFGARELGERPGSYPFQCSGSLSSSHHAAVHGTDIHPGNARGYDTIRVLPPGRSCAPATQTDKDKENRAGRTAGIGGHYGR
jgi:hypothetical protein